MLLRIALIIAVATGLGALGVSFKVNDEIQSIIKERDRLEGDLRTANQNEAEAVQARKKAEKQLASVQEDLKAAQKRLESAQARAKEKASLASGLRKKLDDAIAARNTAQDKLARWEALTLSLEEVRNLTDTLRNLRDARDALKQENQTLQRRVDILKNELQYFVGEQKEVTLPAELDGKVTAVNEEYGFVVISLGSEQGVLERGKLAITRNNQLVGKVEVTNVESNQSVANILPKWSQGKIQKGDHVLTSYEALPQRQ